MKTRRRYSPETVVATSYATGNPRVSGNLLLWKWVLRGKTWHPGTGQGNGLDRLLPDGTTDVVIAGEPMGKLMSLECQIIDAQDRVHD